MDFSGVFFLLLLQMFRDIYFIWAMYSTFRNFREFLRQFSPLFDDSLFLVFSSVCCLLFVVSFTQ